MVTIMPTIRQNNLRRLSQRLVITSGNSLFLRFGWDATNDASTWCLTSSPGSLSFSKMSLNAGEEHCVTKQKRLRGRLGQRMMVKKSKTDPQASSDKNPIIFETAFYHFFFIFTRSDLDHQNRTFLAWFRDPSTRKRVTKNGVSKMSAFLWARP